MGRTFDDEAIIDVISAPSVYPSQLTDAMRALFRRVVPALSASLETGTKAWDFCNTRKIVRPDPVGALDALAARNSIARAFGGSGPLDEMTRRVEAINYQSLREDQAENLTACDLRELLVYLLRKHAPYLHYLTSRVRKSETGLPILGTDESDRLLALIEPLQLTPDFDLPLLHWKDSRDGGARTSWREPHPGWTPVDVGMPKPGYLLLARHDRLEDVNEGGVEEGVNVIVNPASSETTPWNAATVLKRRTWDDHFPTVTDDELLRLLNESSRPSGDGHRVVHSLYPLIEESLLASVMLAAAARRRGRDNGMAFPRLVPPVAHAAALVSYRSNSEIPAQMAMGSWLIPGNLSYEQMNQKLVQSVLTLGDVRVLLVFYLLERHAIRDLRTGQFADHAIPTRSRDQSERVLKLVEPLETEYERDLPLLLWRDEKGLFRTSRGGQSWTNLDTLIETYIEQTFDVGAPGR